MGLQEKKHDHKEDGEDLGGGYVLIFTGITNGKPRHGEAMVMDQDVPLLQVVVSISEIIIKIVQ